MRHLSLIVLLLSVLEAVAMVPDPSTRLHINSRGVLSDTQLSRGDDDDATAPYQPLIIKVGNDATIDSLRAFDVIIYNQRADLVLTSVPRDSLQKVLSLEGVIDAAASGDMSSCLDVARPFSYVDAAQLGVDLPQAYTGEGVVVGFSDIGFDPSHIAFKGRLAQVIKYNSEEGTWQRATTPDEIAQFGTDDKTNYHATHVANILAGGYKGNEYYGVATGAEIVATMSKLHDVGILAGVEDIISYAKSQNKRAVINLSLSNHLGPHDGTSLMCQYLSLCAKDAVICISAGNSGNLNTFATQVLGDNEAAVTVNSRRNNFDVMAYTDIWSESDLPFEFSIQVYDTENNLIVYESPWVSTDSYITIDDADDNDWAQYMCGKVYAECGWSKLNGRYNALVYFNTHTDEVSSRGNWARYTNCIKVRRCPDVDTNFRVNIFADTSYSFLGRILGNNTIVGAQGSINDMCTAEGIISVGMATSRNTAPLLNGTTESWDIPENEININTSYSATPGIKRLPIISAPGAYLISAISKYYVMSEPDVNKSAMAEVDGNKYYWMAAGGTSMSSPFVAGVIALWLQADPTLTTDDIIEIARTTADTNFADIDNPRWGAGCINAQAGLQKVIQGAGIAHPSLPATVRIAGRRLTFDGVNRADVRLHTISGLSIDPATELSPGLYILTLPGTSPQKIAIK